MITALSLMLILMSVLVLMMGKTIRRLLADKEFLLKVNELQSESLQKEIKASWECGLHGKERSDI